MIPVGILPASCMVLLAHIDLIIAFDIRAAGCPRCQGPLHAAHYQRKPRGHTDALAWGTTLRLSWCCGRDGCRHRVTPPSTRFWGPLVYTGPTVLALQCTAPGSPDEVRLRDQSGCSRHSVHRWRDRFVHLWETATGRTLAGALNLEQHQRQDPCTVLSQWVGRWAYRATRWMRFIHRLTGGRGWETDGQRLGSVGTQNMDMDRLLCDLQDAALSP